MCACACVCVYPIRALFSVAIFVSSSSNSSDSNSLGVNRWAILTSCVKIDPCLQNNYRLHQNVLVNVLCCVFKVDRLYEDFFYQLHAELLLNNTLLVFLSDHGFRFGVYRRTPIGK